MDDPFWLSIPQWPYAGLPDPSYGKDGDSCLNYDCDVTQKHDGQWHFVAREIGAIVCPSCNYKFQQSTPMSEREKQEAKGTEDRLRAQGYFNRQ